MQVEARLPKLVFTAKEVCEILDICRTSLWKLVKSGKLKRLYTGTRRLLFAVKTVEEFINNNQTKF